MKQYHRNYSEYKGELRRPSCVLFHPKGRLFGTAAKGMGLQMPQPLIDDARRILSTSLLDAVNKEIYHPIYQTTTTDRRMEHRVDVDGTTQRFTPVQVNAMILQYLKESAEEYLKCPITKAVVICPNRSILYQRNDLMEAAELAGLHVQLVLMKSTAAALACGIRPGDTNVRYLMVFDYGGGKVNIIILSVQSRSFRTLARYGSHARDEVALDILIMK